MMTVCMFPIHQIISFWTFWSPKLWQFMAKLRMLQNNIAKSSDFLFFIYFFHEFEISKFWMGSLFKQVSAALSKEALKESKLLFGIDFTRSNEWAGLWSKYNHLLLFIFHSLMYELLMEQNWDPLFIIAPTKLRGVIWLVPKTITMFLIIFSNSVFSILRIMHYKTWH